MLRSTVSSNCRSSCSIQVVMRAWLLATSGYTSPITATTVGTRLCRNGSSTPSTRPNR